MVKKKNKNTSLEIEFANLLFSLGLGFKKQHRIGNYPVDFYLKAHNLSIQVDGCFHHGCPSCYKNKSTYPRQQFQKRRDGACNLYHGYVRTNLVRFKECYIKSHIDKIPSILYDIFEKIKSGKLVFEEYTDE